MQSRISKFVSFAMAILFPLALMAGETGAMAVPNGTVTVNGNAISRPAAIFAGDRINTTNGSVSMSLSGSSVVVTPKSSVVFAPNQMNIASGGVRVLTTTGLSGQVRNLTLAPAATGKTSYMVAERDGKILIAALEGSLKVNDGKQEMTLAANHAVAIPVQEAQPTCAKGDKKCESEMKKCKGDKDCQSRVAAGGAAVGAGAAAAGTAAGASVSTAMAVGIAAAVAAASAGISYGVVAVTNNASASGG